MTRRHSLLLPLVAKAQDGGAKYAVLDGDSDQPNEHIAYAFWMPAGPWVPAHTHSQQAQVAVVKGTLLLGFGQKQDRQATRAIRAGAPHNEGGQAETQITGSALGGWKTTIIGAST